MKTKAIDILKAIKQLFQDMPPVDNGGAEPDEPTGSIVMNTTDGVEVVLDKLAVGGKAMIAGQPAAAGTYTFTDGSSIVVDMTGTITTYNPAPAATPQATIPDPTLDAKQPPVPATPAPPTPPTPAKMAKTFKFSDIKKPEDMEALFASFASGTSDDRIANLEIVCKALMEYCYGWDIRQAKEQADKNAAINVYQNDLSTVQAQMKSQKEFIEKQQGIIKQMFEFMEEFAGESTATPPGENTKKGFNLGKEKNKGAISKFAAAAQQLKKEAAQSTTTA